MAIYNYHVDIPLFSNAYLKCSCSTAVFPSLVMRMSCVILVLLSVVDSFCVETVDKTSMISRIAVSSSERTIGH
jgi:hypothetical protein